MKPVNKTRRLIVSFVIFILIILIGFITFKKPVVQYAETAQFALQKFIAVDHIVQPPVLFKEMAMDDKAVLIDLRNPYDFAKSHIEGSMNVSIHDVLNSEFVDELENWQEIGQNVVMIGNSLTDVNGVVLLLRQLGFENTFALAGGYDVYEEMKDKEEQNIEPEKAMYDYAALLADKTTFGLEEAFKKTRKAVVSRPRPKVSSQDKPEVAKPAKKVVAPKPVIVEEEEEDEGGC